jgi:hypothetical protein
MRFMVKLCRGMFVNFSIVAVAYESLGRPGQEG